MNNYFSKSLALFSLAIIFSSCTKDEEAQASAPTVESETTSANVEVTYTTVEISGDVSSTGGSEIVSRGVCWSTDPSPTIDDNKTVEATNTFTTTVSDLMANTTYYFRVYATNDAATGYGAQQSYSTSSLDSTTWDFLLIHDSNTSWNADVFFKADGTTVYDEPANPGLYTTYGTWSLNGNTLSYDMDSTDATNTSYQFTGTLSTNTMSGTYTFGTSPDKTWTATKY